MQDHDKSKEQLIKEIQELRQRVTSQEKFKTRCNQLEDLVEERTTEFLQTLKTASSRSRRK